MNIEPDLTQPGNALHKVVQAGIRFLSDLPNARQDAEILLAKILDKDRAFLRARPEHKICTGELEEFQILLQRRKQGEPLAYLLGQWEFWSLPLKVNKFTLVPRPETEILVEYVLASIGDRPAMVADLGTGSGAIALALAKERPSWQVWATDASEEALNVASENARDLNLKNIEFALGDWGEALPAKCFHLIVSNPPYIAPNDPHLEGDGLLFEPMSALISEEGGLKDIRVIVAQAKSRLYEGGCLYIEHGANQGQAVRAIFNLTGFSSINTICDLAGLERVTYGKKEG